MIVTLRTCIVCGEPSEQSRCSEHRGHRVKISATARGYDSSWDRLSAKARKLQPFCSDCGAVNDLQCDHTPEAWQRKAAGKPIRLQDVDVVCGPCNRARGAARGNTAPTRGYTPPGRLPDPLAKAEFRLHTPGGIR